MCECYRGPAKECQVGAALDEKKPSPGREQPKALPTSRDCVVALRRDVPLDRLDATLAFDENTA